MIDLSSHSNLDMNELRNQTGLEEIPSAALRRWKFIFVGGVLGLVIAFIDGNSRDKIYEGKFEIVLASDAKKNAYSQLPGGLPFLNTNNSTQDTEIEILKSPAVLFPVFEYVRSQRSAEQASSMRFDRWVESSITVKPKNQTSVLEVRFNDSNKSLILPVTKMISKAYQLYSKQGEINQLDNSISSALDEINRLTPIVKSDKRKAFEYGYENGLGLNDGLPVIGKIQSLGSSTDNNITNFEQTLEGKISLSRKKILSLNVQIAEANKAGSSSIYYASQLSSLTDKSSTFDKLTKIETDLAELKSRFKDNDPAIKRLQRERSALIGYINEQTISLLNGEIDLEKANLKSLLRPQEVLTKYRELIQTAVRNEAILVGLENRLQELNLEKAKKPQPWKLISSPMVSDEPISPNISRLLSLGLLAGLVSGTTVGLIYDKFFGKIYSISKLTDSLIGEYYGCFTANNDPSSVTSIGLLANKLVHSDMPKSISITPVGNVDMSDIHEFIQVFKDCISYQPTFSINSDLFASQKCDLHLLIASLGSIGPKELEKLKSDLTLQSSNIAGWILLNHSDNIT